MTVTDEELQTRLDELKEQFFDGDDAKYQDELEKQGLTEEQVLKDLRTRMLSEKIFEQVTSEVEVTDADIQAYYDENQTQFEQPASREVRHILVKEKAKADDIHQQLENGGNFAKLAKQFSTDPASKNEGGKFTAQQGATVAPFDEVAFGLETGELSEPVKTQFGWHVIEAMGDVQEAETQSLEESASRSRRRCSRRRRTPGSTSGSRSSRTASPTRSPTRRASSLRLRPRPPPARAKPRPRSSPWAGATGSSRRSSSSRSWPSGCGGTVRGTARRPSARSSRTPSRRRTRLRTPPSPVTTRSSSTSSATSSSRRSSSRSCSRSAVRATSPRSRVGSIRSSSAGIRTSSAATRSTRPGRSRAAGRS